MDAKLVVVGGKASKGEVKLKLPTVLGRSRDAGLAIAHPNVSRRHCEIREVEGALVVKDLGSSNGTLVNDEVIQEVVLKPGDTLTVGPLVFRAEYKHAGKFPTLGKKSPKAAVADTLEFAPEDVAPKVEKPAVDKTAAKERKPSAPPPVPEAKKPVVPEVKKPTKEDVEPPAPARPEKVSKPKEKPSELDDLSLPELDDSLPDLEDMPTAATGKKEKKAEVDDLADLPPIEEPVASEWGELDPAAPQDEADADLSLPSDQSESLPELSDDLDLPLPDAESLDEEPELESPETAPPELPAAESLESWSENESESLPELSDDLDLPLPDAEALAEEPELESPETGPPEVSAAESLESSSEVAAEDDLALGDELPLLDDVEAPAETPAAQEPAMELPIEESLEEFAPALGEDESESTHEPAAALPTAEEEPLADELEELGLAEELPPIAEAASEVPMPKSLEPDPAWLEEGAIEEESSVEEAALEEEPAEVDDLPEMTLEEPEEVQEFAAAVEEEIEEEIGELGPIEEMPVAKALEPDPAWLEEPTPAEAELEADAAELDDLPEMTLEEPEEVQEAATPEEQEIEEEMGDLEPPEPSVEPAADRGDKFGWAPGDLQPIEDSAEASVSEDELADDEAESDLTLEASQETKDFLSVEERVLEEEFEELRLRKDAAAATETPDSTPPADAHEPDPAWLNQSPRAELPPAADLEETIDALPEDEESLAEEGYKELNPGPMSPVDAAETPSPTVDDESELDWLDGGSPEPAAAPPVDEPTIDKSSEPSLAELGLENPHVEDVSAVRSDKPTARHEFTSVEQSDPTAEDLSWEPAEAAPTNQAEEEEPLEFTESPPALPEMAAELPEETAETVEEAVEDIGAEMPPALPWQEEPEETVAWSPATEEPPPFSLQPEVERPALTAGTASVKQPEPAKKKKGWSLFGWLKKKEKPTKASSAPVSAAPSGPAPAMPLPIPPAIAEPSFEEAEAPWSPEPMPAEPPVAEFTPASPEDEPEAALNLPEIETPEPEMAELESELDSPQPMDAAGLPPAGEEQQWDDAELDEPEFAAVEPPLSDLDDSSADIDIGPPVADLPAVEDDSELESEPAESAEASPAIEPILEDLAPLESLEMESDEDELRPVETFDNAEAFDEELPDEIAPPSLHPVVEQAESHDVPSKEPAISEQSPPAAPVWQTEHEETVAWTPATEDSPGFSLQPEEDRPARYSEVEARAARADKPATEPVKKKGWSLFGWLKKKEKPTKTSTAPPVVPPAATPQFAAPSPEPAFESEPAFEEAASPLSFPESLPDENDLEEPEFASVEPPVADLDEFEQLEPVGDGDEPSDEIEELEPIADLPEWEPEPDELPEEAPSLEPVAEELPPLESELDDLPPLEAAEELQFAEEDEDAEELSEEVPPLGPPPVAHATESHAEEDATMQWSGEVAQFEEEAEESPKGSPVVPPAKPSVEPSAAAVPTPVATEPPAAEDLPEFMRPKPTPKTVSGEDDDLNEFFQELGLK